MFNGEQLASTYCRIDGLDQDPNGVQIEVHLFGFENDDPVVKKKEYTQVDSKTKAKKTIVKTHWEFNYRHSMSLRAVHPNGTSFLMKCRAALRITNSTLLQMKPAAP